MEDRFVRAAARARGRQRVAQARADAAFLRADQIADRIQALHSSPRVHHPDEAAAFTMLAAQRLTTARLLAAAASEGYGEARCHSGVYLREPHSDAAA